MTETVSLREYLEALREAEKEARDKQHTEYLRRLDALNGEHERIRIAQNSSISRDRYDADQKGYLDWKSRVDGILSTGTGRSEGVSRTDSVVYAIVIALAALAGIAGLLLGLRQA